MTCIMASVNRSPEEDSAMQLERSFSIQEKSDDDTEKDSGNEKGLNVVRENEQATASDEECCEDMDEKLDLEQKEKDKEASRKLSEKESDGEDELGGQLDTEEAQVPAEPLMAPLVLQHMQGNEQGISTGDSDKPPDTMTRTVTITSNGDPMDVLEIEKFIEIEAAKLLSNEFSPLQIQVSVSNVFDVLVRHPDEEEVVARLMVNCNYPQICMALVRKYMAGFPEVDFADDIHRWKLLSSTFKLIVKVADTSREFAKGIGYGFLQYVIDISKREICIDKVNEYEHIGDTFAWVMELFPTCYSSLSVEMKGSCQQIFEGFMKCKHHETKNKAGKSMFFMMLKDSLTARRQRTSHMTENVHTEENEELEKEMKPDANRTPSASCRPSQPPPPPPSADNQSANTNEEEAQSHAASGYLSELSEGLTSLLGGLLGVLAPEKMAEKEGEHLQEIGMPKVFTENIKSWLKDKNRWLAFNRDGQMWEAVKEWFSKISAISKYSESFCVALCEVGIVEALLDIITNQQIKEAYMRNDKAKEVLTWSVSTLHSISSLNSWAKWFRSLKIEEATKFYLSSQNQNIKGMSILILANITAKREKVEYEFTLEDVDLFLATYLAYKKEGKSLANFLAKTNIPGILVENLATHLSGEVDFHGDMWDQLHRTLAILHLFTDKSILFAEKVCRLQVIETVKTVIGNETYKLRRGEENVLRLLQVCLSIIHHSARSPDKTHILVPGLFPHLGFYAKLKVVDSPLRYSSFLTFAHVYGCKHAGHLNVREIVGSFPAIGLGEEELDFVNNMWNSANSEEEKVLGDYLAATGGAVTHTEQLQRLVLNVENLRNDSEFSRFKPTIANLNNLALVSEAFSHEACKNGAVKSLMKVLSYDKFDPKELSSRESTIVEHCLSALHGVAQYQCNMPFFEEARVVPVLIPYVTCRDSEAEMKRRSWNALAFIHYHDPKQVENDMEKLRVTSLSRKDLEFFLILYKTSSAEVQEVVGKLLAAISVPEVICEKFVESSERAQNTNESHREWEFVKLLLHNAWNYTDVSELFSNKLRDAGMFSTLQDILKNSDFKDKLNIDENIKDVILSICNIIFNCVQFESNQEQMSDLRIINDLLHYCKADIKCNKIKAVATLAIAFLVDEDNSHLVRADSKAGVIRFILDTLEDCLYHTDLRAGGFSSIELLRGLCQVAMNDANKVILVYDGIVPIITSLLRSGGSEEKLLSSKLTWLLAFQRDNKQVMRDDENLVAMLEQVEHDTCKELRHYAQGASFELHKTQEKINKVLEEHFRPRGSPRPSGWRYDVMLSYHPESRPVTKLVCEALHQEGLRVWMAEDEMSFGAATEAIEQSTMVLMAMDHRYHTSARCRSEAEYAFDLQKSVLPMKMKRSFKPCGWMGRFVAGKMYVDFSKCQEDAGFSDLVKELIEEIRMVLRYANEKPVFL
ncbi:uncharacterized protein LOC106158546 [Lingula anatina]|uniref:Uncharacterized protein LOC106158546 n=1 Tax=Lingula anatina TaxID=7574 RepID=A0A1S3HWW9_LINAN|nr:uncharacterized protein LOC106158546 [Lingula anatina]|eukprot:XP_013390051.1 uncharacterized protein LOC106158546 [Lingula anatina]